MKSMVTSNTDPSVNPSSQQEEAGCFYQDTIFLLTKCSQEYMNLSLHLLDKNYLHVSLLICTRALESMLNAFYIKQERRPFSTNILLDDIFRIFSENSVMNVESLTFIQSLSFLSQESSLISKMQPLHLTNLIKKADELLLQLSSQLELPYETYHSVFEK